MAEEKKVEKKDDKKEAPKSKKVFGANWEDVFLILLVIASLFLVIIPRLDSNQSINLFEGVESGTQTTAGYGYENQEEPYGTIKGFYNNLLNPHEESVVNEQGQVVSKTIQPSIVDETKFRLLDLFKNIFYAVFFTSIFLSLLFGLLLYHNKVRLNFIKEGMKPKKDESTKNEPAGITALPGSDESSIVVPTSYEGDTNGIRNPRWEIVEKYYNSANQSDWRIAIMEADIMLYDLLDSIGVPGDSIGEKLKNTNKSQIGTLDLAWRAHKIRNELAHQGTSFTLSRTMVEEAIENFRKVFDEFSYI